MADTIVSIITNLLIPLSYLLIGAAAILAIVFPILKIAKDPSGAKSALMGLGILAAISLLGYLFASGNVILNSGETEVIAEGGLSRRVGAGIIIFYFCFIGAIGSLLGSEIYAGIIKR